MPADTDTAPTRLAELREARGLTQVQLAGRADVSLDRIRVLERGPWNEVEGVSLGIVLRLADALGVTPTTLVPRLGRRTP